MWLTYRHLKGGAAEIRFVMGSGRVCCMVYGVYNCKIQNAKKRKLLPPFEKRSLIRRFRCAAWRRFGKFPL